MVTLQIDTDVSGQMMNEFLTGLTDEYLASGKARVEGSQSGTATFIIDGTTNGRIMAVIDPIPAKRR